MNKMIITAALTGSQITRKLTPYIPVTPEEIAEEAVRAYNEGASVVHLHARDPDPSRDDVEVLGEIVERIRNRCPVITQVGSGNRDRFGEIRAHEERLRLLDIQPKPDMETINAGTFTFQVFGGKEAPAGSHGRTFDFLNPPELIEAFARGMKERGIAIEFEAYDIGHLLNIERLIGNGGVFAAGEEIHVNLVMGIGGGIDATPKSLMAMLDHLPSNTSWSVMGIGQRQFPMVTMGMILGGNIRVGLEDNIYLSRGVLARGNGELVAKAVRIARELGREVATVEEARGRLGIL
jgi:3-keto-5-aminohexanoate cleavage enzyme